MWPDEGWTSGFHGHWERRGRDGGVEMGAEVAENQEAGRQAVSGRLSPLSLRTPPTTTPTTTLLRQACPQTQAWLGPTRR